jgi:histone H3/H4
MGLAISDSELFADCRNRMAEQLKELSTKTHDLLRSCAEECLEKLDERYNVLLAERRTVNVVDIRQAKERVKEILDFTLEALEGEFHEIGNESHCHQE